MYESVALARGIALCGYDFIHIVCVQHGHLLIYRKINF